jgi:hypothetical protein
MASIILGMGIGWCPLSQAQMGGGMGGMGAIPGASFESATDPSAGRNAEGFHVVPMITVGQRYDSNVFFAPKTPGLDRDDFVTTVLPQIRGLFSGDLVSVNARVGATGQYYAKNSGLNHVGANAGLAINASKLISQFWPRSRFIVEDTYLFTPEPPAFLTGNLDTEEANALTRGFQAGRVNTQSNSVSVGLEIPISPTVDVTARYSNYLTHFGESKVQQAGALLDTMFQRYTLGLSKRVSLQDTVSGSFLGSKATSDDTRSFTAYGGLAAWDHKFNQKVALRSTAGVQLVTDSFASSTSNIAPSGSLSVLWSDGSTSWRLSYNVSLTPSLQFVGRPILTHVVNFTVIQPTSISNLVAFAGLNYGRGNELGGGGSSPAEISYSSYGGSGGMSYKLTPKTFVVLTCSYSKFDNKFGLERFEFDRNIVQLGLTQAFY